MALFVATIDSRKLADSRARRSSLALKRSDAEEALQLALRLAPRAEIQTRLCGIFTAMVKEGESWNSITRTMLGAAYDGLSYGNWP